jgi:hypothetical protein
VTIQAFSSTNEAALGTTSGNRPAGTGEGSSTLELASLPYGTVRLDFRFFASENGLGAEVGRASINSTIDSPRVIIPTVAVDGTIESVEVEGFQLTTGEKRDLVFTAKGPGGEVVPVTEGSAEWTLVSGSGIIALTRGGEVTAVSAGNASVRATVDEVPSNIAAVQVTEPAQQNPVVIMPSDFTWSDQRLGANTYARGDQSTPAGARATIAAAKSLGAKFLRIPFHAEELSIYVPSTGKLVIEEPAYQNWLGVVDEIYKAEMLPIISFAVYNSEIPETSFGTIMGDASKRWGWPLSPGVVSASADLMAKAAGDIASRNPQSNFVIQIGNENNLNSDFTKHKGALFKLYETAIPKIKAKAPKALISNGALAFWPNGEDAVPVATQLSAQPFFGDIDIISVNFYPVLPYGKSYPPEKHIAEVLQLRSIAGSRRILISEMGANSYDLREGAFTEFRDGTKINANDPSTHLEAKQSDYLRRFWLAGVESRADILCIYEIRDRKGLDPDPGQQAFGILNHALTPKTGGVVLQEFWQELGGFQVESWKTKQESSADFPGTDDSWLDDYKGLLYEARVRTRAGLTRYIRWRDRVVWSNSGPNRTDFPLRPTVYTAGLLAH